MYTLKPKPKPLIVKGKVSYNENSRAKNVIRLKKEVVDEFSDLKDFKRDIGYKLEYHRNFRTLEKRIGELKNNGAMPFLLFLYEEKEKAISES